MRLIERIERLEWIGLHSEKRESIRAYCTRVQKSGTAVVLESYCEGRLDQLVADRTTPVSLMLENLNLTGHAIQIGSHWHPLFLGDKFSGKACHAYPLLHAGLLDWRLEYLLHFVKPL